MPGNRPIFDRAIEGYQHAAQLEDWPQAFRDAVRAVQEFPSDVEARSYLAISLFHTGRYPQAVQLLEELRQRWGDDLLTLAYLARAYEGNQQFERAGAVLLAIAEQALEQRRLPDAVEAFEEVIRIEPAREDVRIRLAEVLVEMGDQRAAAEQCIAIAQGRMARGDYAGAGEALEEATGLDGANQAAHLVRSQLAELTAAATPAVTEALSPAPERKTARHDRLAPPWYRSSAWNQWFTPWHRCAAGPCLKLDPTDFAAYTQLADIYFRQGKLPQALAQYEKLASVYEEHQQLDPAIATLQDAVKLAPSALEIRSRLA